VTFLAGSIIHSGHEKASGPEIAQSASLPAVRPTTVREIERAAFKVLNRFMVPVLRAGLARYMGSPVTGYFLLLRTIGRKSGLPRYAPLNYAIIEGRVYVIAGFGESTHWLANLLENPEVWMKLPGLEVQGTAHLVTDPRLAAAFAVAVARNSGFALAFEDPRCLFMPDEQLARLLAGRPVVAIIPHGAPVEPGPYDPGGHGWIATVGLQFAALLCLWLLLSRLERR
jgi:deazaflavin-dependent oxidoreductase (nitroreductase family)